MDKVVLADDIHFLVGENRIGVTALAGELARLFRRIHADGDHAHAPRGELVETLLETPQLGVAVRSPVAAIEDEQEPGALRTRSGRRGQEFGELHRLAGGVSQGKAGSLLPHLRRAFRSRQGLLRSQAGGQKTKRQKDAGKRHTNSAHSHRRWRQPPVSWMRVRAKSRTVTLPVHEFWMAKPSDVDAAGRVVAAGGDALQAGRELQRFQNGGRAPDALSLEHPADDGGA